MPKSKSEGAKAFRIIGKRSRCRYEVEPWTPSQKISDILLSPQSSTPPNPEGPSHDPPPVPAHGLKNSKLAARSTGDLSSVGVTSPSSPVPEKQHRRSLPSNSSLDDEEANSLRMGVSKVAPFDR